MPTGGTINDSCLLFRLRLLLGLVVVADALVVLVLVVADIVVGQALEGRADLPSGCNVKSSSYIRCSCMHA